MANNTDQLFGDYSPTTDPRFVKTPLKGLTELNFSMNYAAGCVDGTRCLNYSQDDVKTALVGADLVVVCLGTGKKEPVKKHAHTQFAESCVYEHIVQGKSGVLSSL